MNEPTCKMCFAPCYDSKGKPLEPVYVYQVDDEGRWKIAHEIIPRRPLYHIHLRCIPEQP